MREQILAGAVLALAAGVTTSAMASDHKVRHGTGHVTGVHASGMHAVGARRLARVRDFEDSRPDNWQGGNVYGHGGYKSLGPLGITFGCGQRGTCGQGYSVSAWSY